MKDRYSRAFVELLEIIKYMGKEYEKKIPPQLLLIFENNKDQNYQYTIDNTKRLKEQKLLDETLGLLAVIELKYWATPKEKEMLSKVLRNNEIRYQNQLRERYNPDNIFRNNNSENIVEKNISKEVSLIEYQKESVFKKIINKIKIIFNIN